MCTYDMILFQSDSRKHNSSIAIDSILVELWSWVSGKGKGMDYKEI